MILKKGKSIKYLLTLILCMSYGQANATFFRGSVSTAEALQALFTQGYDSIDVALAPGDYHLIPINEYDSSIVSLNGIPLRVRHTYGIKFTGSYFNIIGSPGYTSAIHSHSGYGIYLVDCKNATIEGLIITDGSRDKDQRATDAAIVVVRSKVLIIDNFLFENLGDSGTVISIVDGIRGICVRDSSYATITGNQIARNSWHGIELLSSAQATITKNLIDGVDLATADDWGGGRGTGIIATRNSRATIINNLIKRHWKGIGIYGDAEVDLSYNLVENVITWGIMVWYADSGKPIAKIDHNIIFKTGACGTAIIDYSSDSGETGMCTNNAFIECAQNPAYDSPDLYCFQCALAVQGIPEPFEISGNLFYKNRWLNPCNSSYDVPISEFGAGLQKTFPDLGEKWYSGYSEFIQRFFFFKKG